jgi:hypothetical protein
MLPIVAVLFCSDYYPGSMYIPVLMDRLEMENAVKLESARPISQPGKIYVKDSYLFIVEKHKGVHIIDNSNPAEPENISFLHVDGIRDVAMKTDVLYADNAVDLIAIQFNEARTAVSVSKRIRNYFPEMTPPDGLNLPDYVYKNRPDNTVIVDWKTNNSAE